MDLSQKAASLTNRPSLAGWLYTSARFAAAKIVRSEQRRRVREHEFMSQPSDSAPELDWEKLEPVLDELMCRLNESDREAILMRYFRNHSYAEIASRFEINENTARMRVERAVEKLRGSLRQQGVTTSALLASLISAYAVQLAPAGLAARLSIPSLLGPPGSIGFWRALNLARAKTAFAAVVVAGVTAAFVVENQAQARLKTGNDQLLAGISQFQEQDQNYQNALAAQKKSALDDQTFRELLRLRGEVGVLRDQLSQIDRLRHENQVLFSGIALESPSTDLLSPQDQYTLKLTHAENAASAIAGALKIYADNHNGQYPSNVEQLMSSGILDQSNFVRLSASDFDLLDDQPPDRFGNKNVVILKTPIPIANDTNRFAGVIGAIGNQGVPSSKVENVSNPASPPPK